MKELFNFKIKCDRHGEQWTRWIATHNFHACEKCIEAFAYVHEMTGVTDEQLEQLGPVL